MLRTRMQMLMMLLVNSRIMLVRSVQTLVFPFFGPNFTFCLGKGRLMGKERQAICVAN